MEAGTLRGLKPRAARTEDLAPVLTLQMPFVSLIPVLTGTTELALRALIVLGLERPAHPLPPSRLAVALGCSPTYLGKTLNLLVKADVLQSVRGARGGVVLARNPASITLLEVVEACQGSLVGDFCRELGAHAPGACRFHQVMAAIHAEVVERLAGCSLQALLEAPFGEQRAGRGAVHCRMAFVAAARRARSDSSRAEKARKA
jgi:Rrf2 family protein